MLWRRVCATARADLGFSGRPKCFARPRRYVTPGVHGSVMDGCRRSCEISAVHCGGAAAAPECAERLGAALPSCVIRHIRVGGTTKGTGVSKTGREWRGHPTSRAAADQQQSPAAMPLFELELDRTSQPAKQCTPPAPLGLVRCGGSHGAAFISAVS